MARIIPYQVSAMVAEVSSSTRSETSLFWFSGDEHIAEEGMYQLAFALDAENTEELLNQLPPGYRIVHSIFTWEQDRAGEGFKTGTDNCGSASVISATDSYERVAMIEEADALRRMLRKYLETPDDYEQIEAAYNHGANPYKDDWDRIPYLVRHLSKNADRYFYVDG